VWSEANKVKMTMIIALHAANIARETAVSRSPHGPSNSDFCIIRQLGFKHTFYQDYMPTKILLLDILS
jgi:hypothetical protein